MEKLFLIVFLIVGLFCAIKFIDMKFFDKQMKPIKYVIRDAGIVFISSLSGLYLMLYYNNNVNEFFNVVTSNSTLNPATTQVFTDAPGF
jgi:uncharacterized membrane protein